MSRSNLFGYSSLALVFLLFLGVLIPFKKNHHFLRDDRDHFEIVQRMESNPAAVFEPESKDHRSHPVFYVFLFVERKFLGANTPAYFLIHYLVHLLNAVLLIRLAEKLGASFPAALMSGILFFVSSSFSNVMIKATGTLELLGLSFFLLAALFWIRFLRGARLALGGVFLFQLAGILTYEVTVIFPLFAFCLLLIFEKDPQKRFRRTAGVLLPLFIASLSVFFLVTQDFWHSAAFARKISHQSAASILSKGFSLIRMLVFPVLGWEKGTFPFSFLDLAPVRLIPWGALGLGGGLFLWRTKNVSAFFGDIPKSLWQTALCGILVTVLPHLPHPLNFTHATRYLLFPTAFFMILFGFLLCRFLSMTLSRYPRGGRLIFGVILGAILTINLRSASFHYERYQQYLKNHPEADATDLVETLWSSKAGSPVKG